MATPWTSRSDICTTRIVCFAITTGHSEKPRFPSGHRYSPMRSTYQLREALGSRSGQNLRTELLLHNRDSKEIVVMTNGQVTALVLDPVSNETVGGFSGVQGIPLIRFRALPGESVATPLLIGTASSMPHLGYATPPGRWVIEVALGLGSRGSFRTPPLPITVVA